MSFKTEAAKVRAGIASGGYKKKTNPFQGFVDELAYGLKKQDEEKRQEERVKRQEARVAARATKAKQDAEDKREREREQLANFYFTSTGQDASPQNKSAIMNVIRGGNFTDFSDLEAHMKQYSTYSEGTVPSMEVAPGEVPFDMLPESDVDKQTREILKQEKGTGTIEFGGSRGKDVLSMQLDEVRFELSDPSITSERRAELERRLASLTDAKTYEPTTLYKPDGSEVIARTAEEEAAYLADGFSLVKGSDPTKFQKRTVYKDGASIEVFTQEELDKLLNDDWTNQKPANTPNFVPRTLYKDGEELEVYNQDDLNAALGTGGWSAVKPAAKQDFESRFVYKDGAELKVFSEGEYDKAIASGWQAAKPAKAVEFKPRTLYNEADGTEQVVQSQAEMNAAIDDGFSAIKPANAPKFSSRTLYSDDGKQVQVFTQADMDRYTTAGFGEVKPATVKDFVPRTLYNGNKEIRVVDSLEMSNALKMGFSIVKTNEEKYVARTYYKDGKEIKVLDQEQQNQLEQEGWSGVKLDGIAQIMADLDVDRKTAAQIENGVLKVSTNFAGQPIVIDISQGTSEQVSSGNSTEQQSNLDSLDAVYSQFNPNWKEDGLTLTVNGEQITFTAAEVQNNESFKIQVEDLTGLEGAFGLGGALNKLAGKAGDIFGAEFRAEQNKAITFMSNLRLNTLINLAAATAGGLRDSVWNKQQIIATLPEPARVFEGPIEARNKTVETLRSIQTSLKLLDKALKSNTVAKAQISQSTITRASLRELEKTYLTVLEAFEGSVEPVALPSSFISTPNKTSGETD